MTDFLKRSSKPELAYVYSPAKVEGEKFALVIFCGGYKSDMTGTKATYLEEQCRKRGQAYLRFDYSGHGESGGEFKDGTIGSWKQDALDVLDHVNPEKRAVVLAGSSMGGWISLLMACERPEQVRGMIGIAAAPDFSRKFGPDYITEEQRSSLETRGYYELPNEYGDPYLVTQNLLDDGEKHYLLDQKHNIGVSMHLLQGGQDNSVPVETAYAIRDAFGGEDIVGMTEIPDGDHSLSRPQDLEILDQKVREFSGAV